MVVQIFSLLLHSQNFSQSFNTLQHGLNKDSRTEPDSGKRNS